MRPEPYDTMMDNRATDQLEVIQAHLRGVWTRPLGCPHLHMGDIDLCDANEMRPCVYETDNQPFCDVFHEIIEEWKEEIFKEEMDDKADAGKRPFQALR